MCVLVHVALESPSDIATRNETMGGRRLILRNKGQPSPKRTNMGGGGGGGGKLGFFLLFRRFNISSPP